MWSNSCLNVVEIHTIKSRGEKDTVLVLAIVLSGILSLVVLK